MTDRMIIYNTPEFKGTINDFSDRYNIPVSTINSRIYKKCMDINEAISYPARKRKTYSYNGIEGSLKHICREINVSYHMVLYRVNNGMSLYDAINKPKNRGRKKKIYYLRDFTGTIDDISDKYNIKVTTINRRLLSGKTMQESIDMGRPKHKRKD